MGKALKELARWILVGVIAGTLVWLVTVLVRLVASIFKRGS